MVIDHYSVLILTKNTILVAVIGVLSFLGFFFGLYAGVYSGVLHSCVSEILKSVLGEYSLNCLESPSSDLLPPSLLAGFVSRLRPMLQLPAS